MTKGENMSIQPLKIEYVKVSSLIPYARNSRTHSDSQVAQIAASIKEFGFTNQVLIDDDGGIIAGHGRVMAARKLGMGEVPTITLNGLYDTQKRAYVIADNKLALNAGWDEDALANEMAAEKNGRIARLMELDPKYCDVIIKRWQDFTGKNAVLESNSLTFKELEDEKEAAKN